MKPTPTRYTSQVLAEDARLELSRVASECIRLREEIARERREWEVELEGGRKAVLEAERRADEAAKRERETALKVGLETLDPKP